ncbi:MAG: flavin-dependent oxidoreductase [Pseudomonadota bacterium]
MSVIIVGAGIGGLTLALQLHKRGIQCRLYEMAAAIEPLGVGINLLPHATRELAELDLLAPLEAAGVLTSQYCFYNRYGQLIHAEPRGRNAGYQWPQISIHRGMLQQILLRAVMERLGPEAVLTGRKFVFAEQTERGVVTGFEFVDGSGFDTVVGEALIGCDGIRSQVRNQIYLMPDELRYSGVTMWRGITRWEPVLDGETMIYAGWLEGGKVIVYPVSNKRDADGRQMLNWLCEFYVPPRDPSGDWSQPGKLDDFLWACEDMRFDFLDVPEFVRSAEFILEYPMVDKDPIHYWTDGRITLLGDAAHPMTPRGSNGAGQAILDARVLAEQLAHADDPFVALHEYDAIRRPATARVVEANRTNPPDALLREVYERTGNQPFEDIDEVISREEIDALARSYRQAAGFDQSQLGTES